MRIANTPSVQLTILLLLTLATTGTSIATDHSGTISVSETWLAVDNPHVVTANVTVQAAATLTLEDGVEVYLNTSRGISVYGSLVALGSPGLGIAFQSNTGSNWSSLAFYTGGQGTFEYCTIDQGSTGLTFASTATHSLDHCTISQGSYGLNISNGAVEMTSVVFTGQGNYGFYGNGVAPTLLDSNTLIENQNVACYIRNLDNLMFTSGMTIRNSTSSGLYLHGCENPTVDNITLQNHTGTNGAIFMTDCGPFLLGANNSIGGTGFENSWPVSMNIDSYPAPACIVPPSGNTNNNIRVHGGSTSRAMTWPLLTGVQYVVTGTPNISAGAELIIPDGSEILFATSRGFNIYGTLTAIGSSTSSIRFLSSTGSNWSGLAFYTDGNGALENCLVQQVSTGITNSSTGTVSLTRCVLSQGSYGINAGNGVTELTEVTVDGFSSYGFYGNGVAPVLLDSNSLFENCVTGVHVRNLDNLVFDQPVTLRNNTTNALYLHMCDSPTVDNITIEGTSGTNGALFITDCGEFMIGAGNNIGGTGVENSWPVSMNVDSYPNPACVIPQNGNTNNNIRVHGGSSARTLTWPILSGLQYVVTGTANISAGGELIIPDGSEILFAASRGFNIYGTLTAVGTSASSIRFLPSTGSNWSGLAFYTDGNGALENCLIQQTSSAITQSSTGTVSLSGCVLSQGSYGINASNGVTELTSVTVDGFSSYGFYGNGAAPVLLDSNSVFENCATGVHVRTVPDLMFDQPLTLRNNTNTGLYLHQCDNPTVDNQTIESTGGTNGALFFSDCGEFMMGAGNSLGGSGLENSWPVTMNADSYPHPDCIIPATGNTDNNIRVHGGSSSRDVVWPILTGHSYVVTGTPNFSAGYDLSIPPGSVLYFSASRGFNVYGSLTALGSELEGIEFMPYSGSNWGGINFYTGGSGTFDHCLIEQVSSGITASSTGTVSISNSTIQDASYGINASNGAIELASVLVNDCSSYGYYGNTVVPTFNDALTVFENCGTGLYVNNVPGLNLSATATIRNNTTHGLYLNDCDGAIIDNLVLEGQVGSNGAMTLNGCGEFLIGPGNSIGGPGVENSWPLTMNIDSYPDVACVIPLTGNTNYDIRVHSGSTSRVVTWPIIPGLHYVVSGTPNVSAGGELIIPAGSDVYFNTSRGLNIYGTLTAIGTESEGISFLPTTTSWSGIFFYTAGSGVIENCLIDHASSALTLSSVGHVDLRGSTLSNGSYGLNATSGSASLINNRIINNSSYGIYVSNATLTFGSNLSEWNDIYGNGGSSVGRDYRNGPNDVHAGWVYWGTMHQMEIWENTWDELDDEALGFIDFIPHADQAHGYVISSVDDEDAPGAIVPRRTMVHQNHPNPFNPSTEINFELKEESLVRLQVFDLAGKRVATLLNQPVDAGRHTALWSGLDDGGHRVSSGVYFYRFEAGDVNVTRRMMLVK